MWLFCQQGQLGGSRGLEQGEVFDATMQLPSGLCAAAGTKRGSCNSSGGSSLLWLSWLSVFGSGPLAGRIVLSYFAGILQQHRTANSWHRALDGDATCLASAWQGQAWEYRLTIYRYANIVWFSKYRWNIVIAFFLPYHTIFLGHFLPISRY